jgi:peroxiredoxin
MNLQNREGKPVPNVVFRTRRDHEWVDVTSDELFKGKTAVWIAAPSGKKQADLQIARRRAGEF